MMNDPIVEILNDRYINDDRKCQEIRELIGRELLDIDKYTNALATADTYRNMIREVCKLEADDLEGKY